MGWQMNIALKLSAALQQLLFVAVSAAVMGLILYFSKRKSQLQIQTFLDSLASVFDERSGEATSKALSDLSTLAGHYQGKSALMTARAKQKNRFSEFTIGVESQAPIDFKIQLQSVQHLLLKALHLQGDVQSGDPELDLKLVFNCKDADRFASWVRRPEVREKLLSLMVQGPVARLQPIEKMLTATIEIYERYNLTSSEVEVILRNMQALVVSVESVFGTTATR